MNKNLVLFLSLIGLSQGLLASQVDCFTNPCFSDGQASPCTINGFKESFHRNATSRCICDGQINLAVTPTQGFFYTFYLTTSCGTLSNTTGAFTNLCPGSYIATVVANNAPKTICCSASLQPITVTAPDNCPPIDVCICPRVSHLCEGECVTLTAQFGCNPTVDNGTPVAPTSNLNYFWSTDCGQTGTGPTFTVCQPCQVTLTVTNNLGCQNCCIGKATACVDRQTPPCVCISGNILLCEDGPVTLTANAQAAQGSTIVGYCWTINGVKQAETGNTITRTSVNDSDRICVTVRDSFGCSNTTCVCIRKATGIKVELQNACVCCGDDLTLTAKLNPAGTAPYTFVWTKPNGEVETHTNVNQPFDELFVGNVLKDDAGIYTVTVIDANGCKDKTCAIVKVKKCRRDKRKERTL